MRVLMRLPIFVVVWTFASFFCHRDLEAFQLREGYFDPTSKEIIVRLNFEEKEDISSMTLVVEKDCFKAFPNLQTAYIIPTANTYHRYVDHGRRGLRSSLKEFHFPIKDHSSLCLPVELTLNHPLNNSSIDIFIPFNVPRKVIRQGRFSLNSLMYPDWSSLATQSTGEYLLIPNFNQWSEMRRFDEQMIAVQGISTTFHNVEGETFSAIVVESFERINSTFCWKTFDQQNIFQYATMH